MRKSRPQSHGRAVHTCQGQSQHPRQSHNIFSTCLALRRAQRIEREVSEAEEARAACAQESLLPSQETRENPRHSQHTRQSQLQRQDGGMRRGTRHPQNTRCYINVRTRHPEKRVGSRTRCVQHVKRTKTPVTDTLKTRRSTGTTSDAWSTPKVNVHAKATATFQFLHAPPPSGCVQHPTRSHV